ncbi:MAG: T9SS type A sorting domain-containing protein, partial [Flavobacteriales bacterium]|nr:T9SS type A sorting domain-containing protein [Flavobacteriales bacterium]
DFLTPFYLNSFTWGYIYTGASTMEQMLTDIASADVNLTVNTGGGFLNDIIYGSHEGLGGTPNYWGTWEGTDLSTLHSNLGISATLNNGDWYGCSYTDFAPAIMPEIISPAIEAGLFTMTEVDFWIGTGSDSAIFVVDFLASGSSYAWGYLFNDSTSGDSMLINIAAADADLSFAAGGGFLNDITYDTESGIGGNPNYWGTWSATNTGDWYSNIGLAAAVKNGEWFGCSYTNFAPALRPTVPTAVVNPVTSIDDKLVVEESFEYYPNPTNGIVNFKVDIKQIQAFGLTGKLVKTVTGSNQIDLSELEASIYLLKVESFNSTKMIKVTKQ